jgi:hypothetical protein
VETVPGPRRAWWPQNDSATCSANVSRPSGADSEPRSSLRQGMCRGPGADGMRCVGPWALPVHVEGILRCMCPASRLRCSRCPGTRAVVCVEQSRLHDGKPVQAARLETPAPVPGGAGVEVQSRAWRRENALDAHARSQTPWRTPCRALGLRVIPWLSSEASGSPTPLPHPRKKGSRANAVWRFSMS